MGYSTELFGFFEVKPHLSQEHRVYLQKFADVRHMQRDVSKISNSSDHERTDAGLPLGHEGEYYVGEVTSIDWTYRDDESVVNVNQPPATQPGLWCQWVPSEDGTIIEWDGVEKFYNYVEWLEYIIEHFLKPWGYKLNGSVEWQGEDRDDIGQINVVDNVVETLMGSIVYG